MRKISLLLTAMAMAVLSYAQDLPVAVYTLDFEGATKVEDFNGVQHGDGELRVSSDNHFGTYYQNAPNDTEGASRTNYLSVTQDAFKKVSEQTDGGMTIGLWVNAYEANKKAIENGLTPYYMWSTLFTVFNQEKSVTTPWQPPLMVVNTRLWMQINTDWIWDDFGDDEHVDGQYAIDNTWLFNQKDPITEEEYGFDDNWHYVTVVFSNYSSNVKIYTDGNLRNEWNCRSEFSGVTNFFSHLYKFDNLYLGGGSQWTWLDPDAALAYDDFNVYATALTPEQISLIISMKRGSFTPEQLLEIAKSQYVTASENLNVYGMLIGDDGFSELGEYLMDYAMSYELESETVEGYQAGTQVMKEKLEWAKSLINSYTTYANQIKLLKNYASQTNYPGYDDFVAALDEAIPAENVLTSEADIENSPSKIFNAKKTYLFSQEIPADGSGIVVTKMIQHPWFCNDDAEPTLGDDGIAVYPVDDPALVLNEGGWTNSISPELIGSTDCTMYYTQGRTTWNNWHQSNIAGLELNIHQQLASLPEGYYTVSADLVSNTNATDTHVYATASDGITGISPTFSGNGWDGLGSGIGKWETLTTGKVLVGEDGLLTIGALATTNGSPYLGWYCATNFVLRYYGNDVDMSKELQAKQAETEELIKTLVLKGDRNNANERYQAIMTSDKSDYQKMTELTSLITDVTEWANIEKAFNGIADIAVFSAKEADDTVKGIYTNVSQQLSEQWNAEGATYEDVADMTNISSECLFYADVVRAADAWGEKDVDDILAAQISSLTIGGITSDLLSNNAEELRAAMKAGITSKNASEDNPLDISFMLKNTSFASNSAVYWEGSKPTVDYQEAEFYNTNYNIYQVIENMPKGLYRLEATGFYRDGTNEVAFANYPVQTQHNALLYINEGAGALLPWASDSIKDNPIEDSDFSLYDVAYYTNSMKSAAQYIAKGLYKGSFAQYNLEEDSSLTVGLKKSNAITSDWTLFDDFKLYYLGSSSEESQTDDYFVTVGEAGNTSYPWWSEFSEYYTLKSGNVAHFQFVNYTDMVNFYDNWTLVVASRPDHNTGAFEDYQEYLILRNDWYGWGTLYGNGTMYHNFDPATFMQDMNGAFVDMYVSLKYGTIDVKTTITTNAESNDESLKKVYTYNMTGVSGVTEDEVTIFFVVDHANLQGFVPTGIQTLNAPEANGFGTQTYNIAGQIVNDDYKGIVIRNGKKFFNKY